MSSTTEEEPKKYDLFSYTEEQLLEEKTLTHYEVLGLSPFCSTDQVKKAYRKASLKYHPDKTGRGDDDYVFLAVKHAYDTLYDDEKRQAYDSTTLPFDDSIPMPRSQMMEDPMLLYKDEDFYQTFGPVFQRNLRFDAKLRPGAGNKNKNKKQNKKNNTNNKKGPPSLGDETTPIEEVHEFYEYWIHFESWRDFSAQAADELQVENELENAESRFEKRWIQKEIDKRAKQLKTKENGRIQTLVERAMEADPRLRAERQAALEAKEQAKRDKELAKERAKQEAEEAQRRAEAEEAAKAEQAAAAKLEREQQKKQTRKARQVLRRQTSAHYEEVGGGVIWEDSYDMGVDVDYLCQSLEFEELRSLTDELSALDAEDALRKVHERIQAERNSTASEESTKPDNGATRENGRNTVTTQRDTEKVLTSWTKDELSALAKGVKKYPPGGANRWDQIAQHVNNICRQDVPRSKEECIAKYNEVARPSGPAVNGLSNVSSTVEQSPPVSSPSATCMAGGDSKTIVVPTDEWTAEQDKCLQEALAEFPATMDKNERWSSIAASVPNKSKKECVQRFKAIRNALKK
jgi:DnaJ family protein C protein 2